MNYIDKGGTLPVPFNMIPTPKSIIEIWRSLGNRGRHIDVEWTPVEAVEKQTFIGVTIMHSFFYLEQVLPEYILPYV